MKQVVFVSGKGGTGKSTVVASSKPHGPGQGAGRLRRGRPQPPSIGPGVRERIPGRFQRGQSQAVIDPRAGVSECGLCRQTCRFDAIGEDLYGRAAMACEGCGACMLTCPRDAIAHCRRSRPGRPMWTILVTGGHFPTQMLDIGAEGSGKLVTEVKKNLDAICRRMRTGHWWTVPPGSDAW